MTKTKQMSPDSAPIGTSRATPLPTLLSVNAVAIELSVCTKTVRRLTERGVLPCCRVGRLVRIRAVDLATFVASGTGP
jgi:excisionase family DNA binding protein